VIAFVAGIGTQPTCTKLHSRPLGDWLRFNDVQKTAKKQATPEENEETDRCPRHRVNFGEDLRLAQSSFLSREYPMLRLVSEHRLQPAETVQFCTEIGLKLRVVCCHHNWQEHSMKVGAVCSLRMPPLSPAV